MNKIISSFLLVAAAATPALAQPKPTTPVKPTTPTTPAPAPTPAPTGPVSPPADPTAAPTDPTATTPVDPTAPAPEAPVAEPAPAPEPTPAPAAEPAPVEPAATVSETGSSTDLSMSAERPSGRGNPTFDVELSGGMGFAANPYVQYQGYDFKNGPAAGFRLEGHAVGISLGYELTRMGNSEACSDSCFEGDFGSTTIHAFDLGYRLRIPVGPVRAFAQVAMGGVLVNAGDWNAMSSDTVMGGQARASAGVEIPFADRFFASVQAGYRLIITENPLRDTAEEDVNVAFLGVDPGTADYAEDAHLITVHAGVGVEL